MDRMSVLLRWGLCPENVRLEEIVNIQGLIEYVKTSSAILGVQYFLKLEVEVEKVNILWMVYWDLMMMVKLMVYDDRKTKGTKDS